jgi:hypothetical protein
VVTHARLAGSQSASCAYEIFCIWPRLRPRSRLCRG